MAKSSFKKAKITGIVSFVPENKIYIDDEIKYFNNDKKLLDRMKKILGLGTRYIADDRTTNLDLCEAAAKKLISDMNINKDEIDALIVLSTSLDYKYPASACILQGILGLSEECSCFDITGIACSGYVYGLWLAHNLIEAGSAKKCLLLIGDIASTHSDKRNKISNMLFGDGATATLIEHSKNAPKSYFITGTRGKDYDKLIAPAGGYNIPIKKDIVDLEIVDNAGNVWHLWDDLMKGMDIFKFSTEIAPKMTNEILEFSKNSIESIDYFAFHQANKQIVDAIAKKCLKLPQDKFSTQTFSQYGNCGCAATSIEITRELSEKNHNKLCLATFGIGLSWGFAVLEFFGIYNGGINLYKTPKDKMSREEKIKYWIRYFKDGN